MIDGLTQIWKREQEEAYSLIDRYEIAYWEDGWYKEADAERAYEHLTDHAEYRACHAEETLEQLAKLTS